MGARGKHENDLRAFVFCTNLALKRAQLSLHLATANNYVKENITVLLTLLLVVSVGDR